MPSQQDINENAIRNPQRFQMVFSKAGANLYFARLCCMHTHIIYIYIYIVFICFFFQVPCVNGVNKDGQYVC